MTYIVTCDQNVQIQLPGGVRCSSGTNLPCPELCPRRRFCSMTSTSFDAAGVEVDDGYISSSRGLIRYSANEIGQNFGGSNVLQTFPDLGEDEMDNIDEGDDGTTLEELKPERVYNQFSVRHRIFSNDIQVRKRIPLSRPLNVAIREIFTYWDTNAVFKNDNELNDDFIWLLVSSTDSVIYKYEVDMILKNPSYNRQQKFFHLFYDIVYKDNHPDGFYWCDDTYSSQPIIPRFTNRGEFIKYLLGDQGNGLRFYKSRKSEILSYLDIEDEKSLLYDITCDYEKENGQIILIDPDKSDYIKKFGSKDVFVHNMQHPTDLANMQDMIAFLKQYSLNRHGVSARPADVPFELVDISDDDITAYDAAGIPRNGDSKNAYIAYLSLLKEYAKSYAPQSISVGQIRFSSDSYASQIESYIDDYVRELLIFSDGKESDKAKKNKGKALLGIHTYSNRLFRSYELGNEERLKDKITLFYQLSTGGSGVNMCWYLKKLKKDNIYEYCKAINQDGIVDGWFKEILPRNSTAQIEGAITKYKGMYKSSRS